MEHRNQKPVCPKIFNIGFHKTGTTSLGQFMREYNYRVLHNTAYSMERLHLGSQDEYGEEDGKAVDIASLVDPVLLDRLVQEFDFFSDNPWPLLYRYLDESYPGSRFILTRRNVDAWINSLLTYVGTEITLMRKLIYGYGNPRNHITRYRKVYIKHNNDVIEYFRNRDDLLVIDIESDDLLIAASLRKFLGLEIRDVEFPTANKR